MKPTAILILAVLLGLLFVVDAVAKNNGTITGDSVRIRQSPSINTGVLVQVNAGTRL